MAFSINTQQDGVYQLQGDLLLDDINAAKREGEQCIAGADNSNQTLVFDLSGISASDSSGIALLIAWLRYAKTKNKSIQYTKFPPHLLDIARVSGVDAILPIRMKG